MKRKYEWDVFISHASEDKDDFVRPLAEALVAAGLRVWYDEFTLRIGVLIRKSIDEGLARSKYGIVVLSHSYFEKKWPQNELEGLLTTENSPGERILPIWHRVTLTQVASFSPILAGRYAASSDKGIEKIVCQLLQTMQPTVNDIESIRDRAQHTIKYYRNLSLDIAITEDGKGLVSVPLDLCKKKGEKQHFEPITLESALKTTEPIIIFGHGGQGKTMLATIIAERFMRDGSIFPLLINCGEINREARRPVKHENKTITDFLRNRWDLKENSDFKACFLIDDLHRINPDYRDRLIRAARDLRRDGHIVILFSRQEQSDIQTQLYKGFSILVISGSRIAETLDEFLSTRISDIARTRFLIYAKQYKASILGNFLILFFLVKLSEARNQGNAMLRYLTDETAKRTLVEERPLSPTQIYSIAIDTLIASDIHQAQPQLSDKSVIELILARRKDFAVSSFNQLLTNSPLEGIDQAYTSLLYTDGNGLRQFVHDSYKDYFVSERFIYYLNNTNAPMIAEGQTPPQITALARSFISEKVQSVTIAKSFKGTTPSEILQNNGKYFSKIDGKEMVFVPKGPLISGTENRGSIEVVYRYGGGYYLWETSLDMFIDRFPVTNAEFERFLEKTGHNPDGDWRNYLKKASENHPAIVTSGKDIMAYANWAGKTVIREDYWEKAARGVDGRDFPWGDFYQYGRMNSPPKDEVNPPFGGPQAVDSYPEGESVYGCADMCGNAWEVAIDLAGEEVTYCGGSFLCAWFVCHPFVRIGDLGFRSPLDVACFRLGVYVGLPM